MRSSLLGFWNYERKPEEIEKARREKERTASMIAASNEVVKEYFIDDALLKNPYDDNFQIDINYTEEYIHRVGK